MRADEHPAPSWAIVALRDDQRAPTGIGPNNEHVVKPFHYDELAERIRAIARRRDRSVKCAAGFKRVTAPADGAGRRLGGFGHRQHLHELTCFLIGHLIRPCAG